jgi:nucleotide-binding universal stress UspA family protein
MKVLLPLDLVQPVEPIIASLEALVDMKTTDVNLLYVHELLPAYENALRASGVFMDDWTNQWDNAARSKLRDVAALLKGRVNSVSMELVSGPTAMMIENVARDHGEELVVMAHRQRHGMEKFFQGSVSAKVVQHAPCSSVVLRGSPTKLGTVVVGHDGSAHSLDAIALAAKHLRLGAAEKILLCHAIDVAEPIKLMGPVAFVSALEQNALMQGEVYLAEAEKLLIDSGVKNVDMRLIEGEPANELIRSGRDRRTWALRGRTLPAGKRLAKNRHPCTMLSRNHEASLA